MNEPATSGLIHALILDKAGGCRPVEWQSISNVSDPQQDCLWLHFDSEQEDAQTWLKEKSGLNDISVSALLAGDTRPRALNRGDNLLLALRGMNLNPGAEPDDMVSLRIWTNGRVIVSTRRRTLQATADLIEDLQNNQGPKTTLELLVSWIDRIIQKMNGTVDNLEDQVLTLEDRVLDGGSSNIRLELSSLRR